MKGQEKMQKKKITISVLSLFFTFIFLFVPCFNLVASATTKDISQMELCPGGMPFGVKISSPGLTIVKFTATSGQNASSAYLAGMREGDIITHINGVRVNTIEDFIKEIDKAGANQISIVAVRNNKELNFSVKPKYSKDDGRYKTGIWVKDSTTGIGTVTFINPENNAFAGLGHAICDSSTGKIIPVSRGTVMDVSINGVIKGKSGAAGELKGAFLSKRIGTLTKNCATGVYGILSSNLASTESKMKICPASEVKEGEAYILSTLDSGKAEKYKIKIYDIDKTNSCIKSFKVKVIDQNLIKKSGGIVQGMSGSPIIQNGRLVGAVTHVLINDPTQGYGIFIENMINEMPQILK